MAIVEISNLTYRYPTSEHTALEDINLEVSDGEFLAVVGPNGAGKSTLCYSLSGYIPHFFHGQLTGKIRVAGIDIQQSDLERIVKIIGLVFQNPFSQISGSKFTVYEEIAFGLENLGLPPEEMRSRLAWIMELTGISNLANRSPFALSGGQQQRVALASIMVMKPNLLVLDEPTSQLDPIGTREVFNVIKNLSSQGMTIIMSEHKPEWIAEFADRVIVLHNGRIILEGTPERVLSDISLTEYGIGLTRYTTMAHLSDQQGIWPNNTLYPIKLKDAIQSFSQAIEYKNHPAD
jgi:energy-coupling factor transporter ATP-binding protein EcfA2